VQSGKGILCSLSLSHTHTHTKTKRERIKKQIQKKVEQESGLSKADRVVQVPDPSLFGYGHFGDKVLGPCGHFGDKVLGPCSDTDTLGIRF